jgi:HJR/Mrr/RecB family endonuclease
VGVLLVGPAVVAALLFILTDAFVDSLSIKILLCSIGGGSGAAALAALLYWPSDALLSPTIAQAEANLQLAIERLEQLLAEITYLNRQRMNLVQERWRDLRGDAWEDYLVRVFRALGANAERTRERCSSDQGIDLIVEFAGQRIAVQAKGYGFNNPVGNKAVQEAVAGALFWNCEACAVVTNSRFTRQAEELAESTDCILISIEEIPDLALGKVTIWE